MDTSVKRIKKKLVIGDTFLGMVFSPGANWPHISELEYGIKSSTLMDSYAYYASIGNGNIVAKESGRYFIKPTQVDFEQGIYEAEIRVTFAGSNVQLLLYKEQLEVTRSVMNLNPLAPDVDRNIEQEAVYVNHYQGLTVTLNIQNGVWAFEISEVGLPGKDFKFEDFTPEQIAILQQPAQDATDAANQSAERANEVSDRMEVVVTEAENKVIEIEQRTQVAITATNDVINAAEAKITDVEQRTEVAITATNEVITEAEAKITDVEQRTQVAINGTISATNTQVQKIDAKITDVEQRTQVAITATNEVISEAEAKITDVEQRTTTAINNTISTTNTQVQRVDSKISEANIAITNANSATTNATNAATNANSQRGWTPIHVFEADGTQRQVKKLTDYIGGTGTKPTENIGMYVLENGYTATKSLATNFKGSVQIGSSTVVGGYKIGDTLTAEEDGTLNTKKKEILKYVHSGNKEVKVLSIDYNTNTFYAPNHGLVNSTSTSSLDGVSLVVNYSGVAYPFDFIPFVPNLILPYRIINATTDTFQLSTSVNGGVLQLNNRNGAVDVNKFWFEKANVTSINVSNLPSNITDYRAIFDGVLLSRNATYFMIGQTSANFLRTGDSIKYRNANINEWLKTDAFHTKITYEYLAKNLNRIEHNYLIDETCIGTIENGVSRSVQNITIVANENVTISKLFYTGNFTISNGSKIIIYGND
nr:hypothetical protein [uncultured Flavobacterium sp.]